MNPRGRPRKDGARLELVSAKVTPEMYRALRRIADNRGLKLSEVVRQILAGRLKADANYGLQKIESPTIHVS